MIEQSQMPIDSFSIHETMKMKGFWDPEQNRLDFLRAKTFMQLIHLLDEWYEMRLTMARKTRLEEAADVVIVALDLLGAHGFEIQIEHLGPAGVEYNIPDLVAGLGHTFRKTGRLSEIDLSAIITTLFRQFGKWEVVAAVKVKMEKNAERPALYGVTPA